MLFSSILDLFQEENVNADYLVKIVKSGFVYDLKYDLVYPMVDQIFQTSLVPQYIQNLDRQLINDIIDINSNIYKKHTYINTNFQQYMINDILNTTFLFESYLRTFQFYDIFAEYVSYDFISIIYNIFIKHLAQNVRKIGLTSSFYDIICQLLNIPSSSIIPVNIFFRILYRGDVGYEGQNYTRVSNFFNISNISIQDLNTLMELDYNLVQKTIKSEYYVPNNEYITPQNITSENENLPYDLLYTDITRLEAQTNRAILINVNETSLLNNITQEDFALLVDFLNIFQPEYVNIIIINIISDQNLYDELAIQDDVSVETINYIPSNIIGYCKINMVLLNNSR